jgi:hypothetical protein
MIRDQSESSKISQSQSFSANCSREFRHERAGPHGDDNLIAQIGALALISSESVKGATL